MQGFEFRKSSRLLRRMTPFLHVLLIIQPLRTIRPQWCTELDPPQEAATCSSA